MGPGHLLFSGIGCQSPREVTRGKMARLLREHVAQNLILVNGPIGRHIDQGSPVSSGAINAQFIEFHLKYSYVYREYRTRCRILDFEDTDGCLRSFAVIISARMASPLILISLP